MLAQLDRAQVFREGLSRGEPQIGIQISLADPAVVEILGTIGFDWLLIDHEHTSLTDDDHRRMLQASATSSAIVLARPPRLDAARIMRMLDLGANGIVCPFISTGEDAEQLVSATRYPPNGVRGWGPRRASGYGQDADKYRERADEAILRFAIIETPQAVANIDAITATDGLDGIVIGPQDLALRLGVFGQMDSTDYTDAVQAVRQSCARAGMPFGTGCYSIEHAKECLTKGDALLLVQGDDGLLTAAGKHVLESLGRPTRPGAPHSNVDSNQARSAPAQ